MIKLKNLLREITDSDISIKTPDQGCGDEKITQEEFTELEKIQRESGIGILSDKDLYQAYYVNGKIVGGLYTGYTDDEFSFDIIVDPKYRRQGIGKKMINAAVSEFKYSILDENPDAKCVLDVVNNNLIGYLKTLGFRIKKVVGNHTTMILIKK